MVDRAARAETTGRGPSRPTTSAAAPVATPRAVETRTRTRSRRPRSASGAASGAMTADGNIRSRPTRPTAVAPPSRYATIPRPTVNAHSAVQAARKLSCARHKFRFRALLVNAAPAARSLLRGGCFTLSDTNRDRLRPRTLAPSPAQWLSDGAGVPAHPLLIFRLSSITEPQRDRAPPVRLARQVDLDPGIGR